MGQDFFDTLYLPIYYSKLLYNMGKNFFDT